MDKQNHNTNSIKHHPNIDREFAKEMFHCLKGFAQSPLADYYQLWWISGEECDVCASCVILSCRQIWLFVSLYASGTILYHKLVRVCEIAIEPQNEREQKRDQKQKSKSKRRNDCNVTSIWKSKDKQCVFSILSMRYVNIWIRRHRHCRRRYRRCCCLRRCHKVGVRFRLSECHPFLNIIKQKGIRAQQHFWVAYPKPTVAIFICNHNFEIISSAL